MTTDHFFFPRKISYYALLVILIVIVQIFFASSGFAKDDYWQSFYGNTSGKSQMKAGDPVNMANGSYNFKIPLLSSGGLMDLHATLIYDTTFYVTPNPVFADSDYIAGFGHFWLWPLCHLEIYDSPTDGKQYEFKLEDRRSVIFDHNGNPIVDREKQPINYQMQVTDDYIYLMDPMFRKVYIFDAALPWNLKYVMDRNNNTLTYTYVHHDHLKSVTDGLGRALNFTYTEYEDDVILNTITDAGGRTVNFVFEDDAPDNGYAPHSLRSVTLPGNKSITFHYETAGPYRDLVTSVEFPKHNHLVTCDYDVITLNGIEAPRVVSQTDPCNNTFTFSYDADSNKVTSIRPDGTQVVYTHTGQRGQPATVTDPADKTINFASDDRDRITGATDRLGNSSGISYDDTAGWIRTVTNAEGRILTFTYISQQQSFQNPGNGETVTFTFPMVSRIEYPGDRVIQYNYDTSGNLLSKTNAAGRQWQYTYNSRGQILTATNPKGAVMTYTYNADGTPASYADPDTGTTTYTHDAFKRLSTATNANNGAKHFTYNDNNQVVTVTDERGFTFTYTYDANGNLTTTTDPYGNTASAVYDDMDRIVSSTDFSGRTLQIQYDTMDRIGRFTGPDGINTLLTYDTNNSLKTVQVGDKTWQQGTNAEGIATSASHLLGGQTLVESDKLGRTVKVEYAPGQAYQYVRNDMGWITGKTDPLGRTVTIGYDKGGQISRITVPGGHFLDIDRNELGQIRQLTDFNENKWQFTYSGMGRKAAIADPLGNTSRFSYNNRGMLSGIVYADGATASLAYDAAGNLTSFASSDGLTVNYTYDRLNRVTKINNTDLAYDSGGRLTGTTENNNAYTATYDTADRLGTVSYQNNMLTVTYAYDEETGLLHSVSDSRTNASITFAYDDEGILTRIDRSNHVRAEFEHDGLGRVTKLTETFIPPEGDNLIYIDIANTYDAGNQIIKSDMTVPLDPAELVVGSQNEFSYDAAARLDKTGYDYDKNGRLTACPGHSFEWQGALLLTRMDDTTFGYNGMGKLRSQSDASGTTRFYHHYAIAGTPVVSEVDNDTGSVRRFYVWTPSGMLLYMIDLSDNNKLYFYHFDPTGSTLALTDAAGRITDTYAYTPYGILLAHNGGIQQPYTFIGRSGVRMIDVSGRIYQMGNRFYHADTGRFMAKEPLWPDISTPQAINPYQYAAQNPISNIDPDGMALYEVYDYMLVQYGFERQPLDSHDEDRNIRISDTRLAQVQKQFARLDRLAKHFKAVYGQLIESERDANDPGHWTKDQFTFHEEEVLNSAVKGISANLRGGIYTCDGFLPAGSFNQRLDTLKYAIDKYTDAIFKSFQKHYGSRALRKARNAAKKWLGRTGTSGKLKNAVDGMWVKSDGEWLFFAGLSRQSAYNHISAGPNGKGALSIPITKHGFLAKDFSFGELTLQNVKAMYRGKGPAWYQGSGTIGHPPVVLNGLSKFDIDK